MKKIELGTCLQLLKEEIVPALGVYLFPIQGD